MKTICLLFALVLAGCQGCATKQAALKCPACPPCEESKFVQCAPEPTTEGVKCHYRHYVKMQDGSWQTTYIQTVCVPRCVDGDGLRIPGCR